MTTPRTDAEALWPSSDDSPDKFCIEGGYCSIEHARQLERELAAARAELAQWREAVLNELIVAHIYTKEHDTDQKKAIQDAITWNCQVSLDPAVSSDARALIAQERERAERAEKRSRAMRELAIDAWYCATEKMEPAFWDKTKSAIDAAIAEGKK